MLNKNPESVNQFLIPKVWKTGPASSHHNGIKTTPNLSATEY
jgi:hypothetical protein